MAIRVALHHRTDYRYDRPVDLFPQVVRLRPAPHCRTPITAYSLDVGPANHFENWQQDPHGNFLLRLVFPEKVTEFSVEVNLVAELTVINPFDFFLETYAQHYPFTYEPGLAKDLQPFLECAPVGPRLAEYLRSFDLRRRDTCPFLFDINAKIQQDLKYLIRLEPGVQTAEETLERRSGSCRDQAWLEVQILRNLGLAARFVSGYSIQLKADQKALDGPSGVEQDVTDLHAWTEVFLPGAGWIGLDPTSGLFAGEGHIPLAATPAPSTAAPIAGAVEKCETKFDFTMSIARIHEDPRVTKPYREEEWSRIEDLGHLVDERLAAGDVRLTMGGEPTFVSIDDMEGAEWNTEAVGPTKRVYAGKLLRRLKDAFGPGGLLHFGLGKWYPGEQLPRWALSVHWRTDGVPVWRDAALFAQEDAHYGHTAADAQRFSAELARRLQVDPQWSVAAYEDLWYYLWRERRLPINVDPFRAKLKDDAERARLARVFEAGLGSIVGYCLPLKCDWQNGQRRWSSGPWPVRPEAMFLLPGDSPMGLRLPLDSLPWVTPLPLEEMIALDPFEARPALTESLRRMFAGNELPAPEETPVRWEEPAAQAVVGRRGRVPAVLGGGWRGEANAAWGQPEFHAGSDAGHANGNGHSGGPGRDGALRYREEAVPHHPGDEDEQRRRDGLDEHYAEHHDLWEPHARLPDAPIGVPPDRTYAWVVRTALCVEPREGRLHVFLPPTQYLEDFLDLVEKIEATAAALQMPIVVEGYLPPRDSRLKHISVTPDPGVIEVNIHPSHSWGELVHTTTTLYEEARQTRLGCDKFNLDGRHTGTGGGNHVVLGGATPSDSPFLRRPDLLRSLIGYWNNHPSLSYLFSGLFIGPTSQAPRVDEGRRDALYELELAFRQIPEPGDAIPPWLVDRIFRNLLVDLTGNTHRAEFCIDKLFSPDGSSGRLGLVEFRAFEMPPHARMSLTQQLLIRALIARFWEQPYRAKLVEWGTTLHDRWMLPHFLRADFDDVCAELQQAGLPIEAEWFAPHFEFRCPAIGQFARRNVHVELRQAIEPWYVLGEEAAGGGTARYVDSSVERLQVKVRGMTDGRHAVVCNGRMLPLHPTGNEGEFVAGVRYRAWQPPHCLHPTIAVDTPLVFDVVDTWMNMSVGGCTYHVAHPGGRNYTTFPVNAYEAESRRVARFFTIGHHGGRLAPPPAQPHPRYPLTLDLRYA